jgi:hypothetical protein
MLLPFFLSVKRQSGAVRRTLVCLGAPLEARSLRLLRLEATYIDIFISSASTPWQIHEAFRLNPPSPR